MLKPEDFFYLLSDETRLRCLLLLLAKSELCVCDFTCALQIAQPKISRHLAILRGSRVVSDRRAGAWVYYSIHSELPQWASHVLLTFAKEISELYSSDLIRLNERDRSVCEESSESKGIIQTDNSLKNNFSNLLSEELITHNA